jgi:hypothetical protein
VLFKPYLPNNYHMYNRIFSLVVLVLPIFVFYDNLCLALGFYAIMIVSNLVYFVNSIRTIFNLFETWN